MRLNELTPVLRMRGDAWRALRLAAERAAPDECCGALLGTPGTRPEVCRALRVPNRAADRRTGFLIHGSAVRRLERAAQRAGLDIIGFYHSHPRGSTAPSARDLADAWPGYIYVIIGSDGHAAGWRLHDDRSAFARVELRLP